MVRELLIGAAAALAVFALTQGIELTPIVVVAGVFLFLRFAQNRDGRRFEVLGSGAEAGVSNAVTFADIGGQEEAKREFMEALELVLQPEKAAKLGVRPLKGILLVGPPGTGKTLLAKAAAGFTDAAFLAASGSQFIEMYAGVGAQRVRRIFRDVRTLARRQGKRSGIIFIDEMEVLGGKRGKHTSHLEYDQTLNELLVQMDGLTVDDDVRVLVVAATNRADLFDDALLRPGRFDRIVRVDLPDKEGRLAILRIHARGRPLAGDVSLDDLAAETYGFSGAHLEAVMNEASILAMRHGRDTIEAADFREAVDKVLMGEKLDRRPRQEELERIAYHEAGHALLSELVRPGSVSVVTVTPRGQAMGYMRQTAPDNQYLYTRQDLLDQISVALAGAVAEDVFLGSRSTGASGDFAQAVQLAERLVEAGLSDLGVVNPQRLPPKMMHDETQRILRAQEEYVRRQVEACRERLQDVACTLLEKERISGDDFRRVIGELQPLPAQLAAAVNAVADGLA